MRQSFLALVIGCSFGYLGQVYALAPVSGAIEQPRVNMEVPKDAIDLEDMKKFFSIVDPLIVDGQSQVVLQDLVDALEIKESAKQTVANVLASREPNAALTCRGRRCEVRLPGKEYSFQIDGIQIPGLGKPTVYLASNVVLFLELSEDFHHFEACQISGVKVKAGLLQTNLDGFLANQDGNTIHDLKIDVGPGGDYPKTACRLQLGFDQVR